MTKLPQLLMVLALLGACEDDAPKPAPPAPSTATPAPSASGSASGEAREKLTGILTESEFKALHELKGEAAPPARGEMIELPSSRAYLSMPKVAATPPIPAVLVIHEWWGLNDHIKHWADRLTEDGYAALAVDLYGGKVATNPDDAMTFMKAVDEEAARKVLLEAFDRLGSEPRIKADKRASIGWCFGGKWSLELALAAPRLSAAVLYYGHVETDPARLAALQSPVLAIFGTQDKSIDEKYVDRFRFGIEQAGPDKDVKILTYDADHAFANPSGANYDFADAEAAWSEVRSFLGRHLKGPAR